MEFKKTTKIWRIYPLRFSSLAGTQSYKRSFVKKTKGIKLKFQGKHMTSTCLLMFTPEFSLEREICNTLDLSSHT